MKKLTNVLVISGVILIILTAILITVNVFNNIKNNIIPDLGDVPSTVYTAELTDVWEPADYFATDEIVIVAEIVDDKRIEVIDLGEVGILGSKLSIDNVRSNFKIDQELYEESLAASMSHGASISDQSVSEQTVSEDLTSTDPFYKDPSVSEDEIEEPKVYKPSVVEYVEAKNSSQKFNYVVYAPENCDENTPVFLFLHGIGENGTSYNNYINTFSFLKYLIEGSWKPDFVVIAPILVSGSRWRDEATSVKGLIGEVIDNYGGSWDKLYIGGFSAGCDSITPLAQSITFQGAIYMAGYMGGSGNSTDVAGFVSLWRNKRVFYFRDSLYKGGGYGYSSSYINGIKDNAESNGIFFIDVDMNWNHRSAMVDAVFLPGYFKDNNGEYCHDAITDLIY